MIYVVNNKAQVMSNGKMLDYVQYYPQNWGLQVSIDCYHNGYVGRQISASLSPFGNYISGINKVPERNYALSIESVSGNSSAQLTSTYYYYDIIDAGNRGTVTNTPNSGGLRYTFWGAYPTAFSSVSFTGARNSPFRFPTAFSGQYRLPKSLDIYVKSPGYPSTPWVPADAPHIKLNVINMASARYYGYDPDGVYDYPSLAYTAVTGSATSALQTFHFDISYPEV